jgi:hypothetical protein
MTVVARPRSATADQHGHLAVSVKPTPGGHLVMMVRSRPIHVVGAIFGMPETGHSQKPSGGGKLNSKIGFPSCSIQGFLEATEPACS